MKKIIISTILLGTVIFTGCYYDKEELLYPNSICDVKSSTFSSDVQSIIKNNCATSGCHVAGATFPDLTTYASIKTNIDRVKVRAITEKTMPKSNPLSDCNIKKLQLWIDNGSLNN